MVTLPHAWRVEPWLAAPVPRPLLEAGQRRKERRCYAIGERRVWVRSHAGLPLFLSASLFLASVVSVSWSISVAATALAAASLAFAGFLAILAYGKVLVRAYRREELAFHYDAFSYGVAAAGGVGVLVPADMLRLEELGQPYCKAWCAENLGELPLRETFEALSVEWAGSSDGLLEACRSL